MAAKSPDQMLLQTHSKSIMPKVFVLQKSCHFVSLISHITPLFHEAAHEPSPDSVHGVTATVRYDKTDVQIYSILLLLLFQPLPCGSSVQILANSCSVQLRIRLSAACCSWKATTSISGCEILGSLIHLKHSLTDSSSRGRVC